MGERFSLPLIASAPAVDMVQHQQFKHRHHHAEQDKAPRKNSAGLLVLRKVGNAEKSLIKSSNNSICFSSPLVSRKARL
ncbi:hypothetical protein [Pseudomonas sp.]|uniref:hypothetical protein n=1 Tax=Pseudomonas sp. TaxID=306 RepID=UPI002E327280|nr:hypothetical protein [Pseudomonas sp.]HEX4550584.1 hypothetical protein [Pseudomonas sp.]